MKKGDFSIKRYRISGTFIILLTLLMMVSCARENNSRDLTNPNPAAFNPTGTIQGVIRDSVTLEPIVGAKVSVGLTSATTNEKGEYVLSNLPATFDELNGSIPAGSASSYQVTVDLRSVTSPVNMTSAATTIKYPEFVYTNSAKVNYTSLNDTECQDSMNASGTETCTSASNHDTPVDGLVSSNNISVGRLACNIKGTLYGCDASGNMAEFATAKSGEVRLELVSSSDENSATGSSGNIIIPATATSASSVGAFEFNNIECGSKSYMIVAADDLDDPTTHDSLGITGPAGIGETLVLHLDEDSSETNPDKNVAIHLCPNDDIGPKIIAVSPESGSDLSKSSTQTVTITFHEPVDQTAFTDTTASPVDNLYDWIEVSYDGSKAGNIAYQLTWLPSGCTTTCTQLQVTFPTGTSSKYRVTLKDVGLLKDASGNAATPGVCPVDAPTGWTNTEGAGADDDCVIAFTTTGGNTPSQISDLVLVNDSSLDEAGVNVGQYDWSIVSGAKTYAMACQKIQVWGTTTQDGPFVYDDPTKSLLGSEVIGDSIGDDDGTCETGEACDGDGILVNGSTATVDFDMLADGMNDDIAFVENEEVELRYNCQVAGVSSDGVTGELSAVASDPADDEVGPTLEEDGSDLDCPDTGTDPTDSGTVCSSGSISQVILEFNEELNEDAAETAANYTISGLAGGTTPTISSASYSADDDSVTLTLSSVIDPANIIDTRITTGANGIANTTASGDDTQVIAVNSGAAGGALGPCVIDNGADTTESGDDVDTGGAINSGADGFCNTTANTSEGDVQLQTVGTVSGTCVTDPDDNASTTPSGDDVLNTTTTVGYIHVGPNGICNTTANAADTQTLTVGNGVANTIAVTGGVNGLLDTETLTSDDSRSGSKITVSGVTDVGGNTIRTSADEYFSDGSIR